MNKYVITSVRPEECNSILGGLQTMLVRKKRPKIETPFKCYIYMTATKERCRLWEYMTAYINSKGEILNGSQKVIGSFVCDEIIEDKRGENADVFSKYAWISLEEQKKYGANKPLFGWHISDLKIYDRPKELGEFWAYNEKLHELFANDEDFCCYNGTNEYGELLNECSIFNTDIKRCYSCWEEWSGWCHRITRPPQPYVYCEPIEEE